MPFGLDFAVFGYGEILASLRNKFKALALCICNFGMLLIRFV